MIEKFRRSCRWFRKTISKMPRFPVRQISIYAKVGLQSPTLCFSSCARALALGICSCIVDSLATMMKTDLHFSRNNESEQMICRIHIYWYRAASLRNAHPIFTATRWQAILMGISPFRMQQSNG